MTVPGSRSRTESPDLDPSHPPRATDGPLLDTLPSAATTSPIPVVPSEGGFPTFADTNWGDPIAAAQPLVGKPSAVDVDANSAKVGSSAKDDQMESKPGQGRGKVRRTVGSGAMANGARGASSIAQASELDFDVLAGGPGESWADPHVQVVW
jgi:hypothetical protein